VSSTGTRLNSVSTSKAFTRVRRAAAITAPVGLAQPRLYDLRHYVDGRVMRPAGPCCLVTNGFGVSLSA
jgi:hypothetical protein